MEETDFMLSDLLSTAEENRELRTYIEEMGDYAEQMLYANDRTMHNTARVGMIKTYKAYKSWREMDKYGHAH